MENGLMNSHMMGFTDVRGLNILEDAIAKHPNEKKLILMKYTAIQIEQWI